MKNNKTILLVLTLIVMAVCITYFLYTKNKSVPVVITTPLVDTSITYDNTNYGFTFSLPIDWKGYLIIQTTWQGTTHGATAGTYIPSNETGPTLSIRNPNWTPAVHYEDIPILVFTIAQWNSYLAWNFSVSAAPILASELARNNKYVFALPPRWDYDYSKGYQEAENILTTKPLHPYNL